MTTRRSAWRLVGTALVMSGALALSGCSGATRPGTALVVDGTTYSQAQVSEATRQLNTMAELAAQPLSDKTTVNWLVVAPFVLAHSDAKGLWTPDAGYNAMMAQIASPTAETVSIVRPTTRRRPSPTPTGRTCSPRSTTRRSSSTRATAAGSTPGRHPAQDHPGLDHPARGERQAP
ncbi:MAG: hypothetical protein IPL93_02645 [Actinomycetales bacterium]|nr:hypothetical protein [Actinomycetales bacterium]